MNQQITNLPHQLSPNADAPTVAKTCTGAAQTLVQLGLVLDDKTTHVLVSIETADVRVSPTGTPTTTVGQLLKGDVDRVLLSRTEAADMKWIKVSADATLQISQYST